MTPVHEKTEVETCRSSRRLRRSLSTTVQRAKIHILRQIMATEMQLEIVDEEAKLLEIACYVSGIVMAGFCHVM